jgi:Putative transposase
LFLEKLMAAHEAGALKFFGTHAPLTARKAFATFLARLRKIEWVVYAKRPFGGPQAVLAYLSRYTHRVAISNSRLIAFNNAGVTFNWKDYRAKGRERAKVMTLAADEFIRRFLIHVLPTGFHRIRHYGLFASGKRAENIARARELLDSPAPQTEATNAADANGPPAPAYPCQCCGGRMIIIETFRRGAMPRYHQTEPTTPIIDTS